MDTAPTAWRLLAGCLVALAVACAARPVVAATGEPDSFGYSWVDNFDGCGIAPPSFTGDLVTYADATDVVGPVVFSFPFTFYGRQYDRAWISPTGFLSFTDPLTAVDVTQNMPDPTPPNLLIAAHWTRVINATITVEARPDEIHVRWLQLIDAGTARWVAHLVLRPDGGFSMYWTAPGVFNENVAVGFEDSSGTLGRTIFRNGIGENGFLTPGRTRSVCVDPPSLLDCSRFETAGCGDSISTNLDFVGRPQANDYDCWPILLNGEEQIWRVTITDIVQATVGITDGNLTLMRIANPPCTAGSCVDVGPTELSYSLLFPGLYWFVVDQEVAGPSPPFLFTVDCSPAYETIDCGGTDIDSTVGLSNSLTEHSCAGAVLNGPERIYRYTNPVAQTITALVDSLEPNMWVVIYDAATFESGSTSCLAAGRGGAAVPDAAAGDYVILVEGEDNAAAGYTLRVSCGTDADCTAEPLAQCLDRVVGDTTGGPEAFVSYTCLTDAMVAPEAIYRFNNPIQQALRARFVSSQPGQRMFLLTACNPTTCLLSGDLTLQCPQLPPGEYVLVVDGPVGSEGPFEIELSCGRVGAGVDLEMLSVDSTTVASNCSDLTADGTVFVTIANTGTSTAVAPFEVVVFEDALPTNDLYEPGVDQFLGMARVDTDMPGGSLTELGVTINGTLRFRDGLVHAAVDAGGVIGETNETNNVRHSGIGCEWRPAVGVFTPVVEWEVDSFAVLPTYREVDMTPLVADINVDGIPDVIVSTGANGEGFDEGVVRVLDGRDGTVIWTADQPDARVWMTSNLAVADVDGDGRPEIVGHSYVQTDLEPGHNLVCLDDDGSVLWRSQPFIDHPIVFRGGGGASIADMDCDGTPEIAYGANVFKNDGTYFWAPEPGGFRGVNEDGRNLDGALSVLVDIDADGELELVAGPTAYKYDPLTIDPTYGVPRGSIVWHQSAVLDGFPAVGQFEGDDGPEIVITSLGMVYLLDGEDGRLIWENFIPTGGGGCALIDLVGGPPTVADFDGDCAPEIGVAGADYYVVFETNGAVKWVAPIVDCSSHRTASSVFDFDGDGAAEVAFADEERLHVYRGFDGFELASLPSSSHTWQEMITIADVDADDNAEIVLPLNSDNPARPKGVQVIGDIDSAWVNTRRIWNQHQYHINNINDDGTVPGPAVSCEAPSWLDHGTYRDQIGQAVFIAPDLTLTLLDAVVVDDNCIRHAEMTVRIGNGGGRPIGPDAWVWFYEGDPGAGGVGLTREPVPPLLPGEWVDLVVPVPLLRVGPIDIHVRADDNGGGVGVINECREDNNHCWTTVVNDAIPIDPPVPVGPALRATWHSHPEDMDILARYNWLLDAGLPRPPGDHYHILRGQSPVALTFLDTFEPYGGTVWVDSTRRARDFEQPLVHFYKVFAADMCEQLEPEE